MWITYECVRWFRFHCSWEHFVFFADVSLRCFILLYSYAFKIIWWPHLSLQLFIFTIITKLNSPVEFILWQNRSLCWEVLPCQIFLRTPKNFICVSSSSINTYHNLTTMAILEVFLNLRWYGLHHLQAVFTGSHWNQSVFNDRYGGTALGLPQNSTTSEISLVTTNLTGHFSIWGKKLSNHDRSIIH